MAPVVRSPRRNVDALDGRSDDECHNDSARIVSVATVRPSSERGLWSDAARGLGVNVTVRDQ